MTGFLTGKDFVEAARLANACGAIVVSRHAVRRPCRHRPSWTTGSAAVATPRSMPMRSWPICMHHGGNGRLAELNVLAFDHRSQFADARARGARTRRALPRVKQLLVQAGERSSAAARCTDDGVLIDGGPYGEPRCTPPPATAGGWAGRSLPGSRRCAGTATHSIARR